MKERSRTHKLPLGETTTGATSVFATVVTILNLVPQGKRNGRDQTEVNLGHLPLRG